MYFAGDGFSSIIGGINTLSSPSLPNKPKHGFDFILTNPPYGSSQTYGRTEEAFLSKTIELLKQGVGWGLIVLPTGVIENPRSAKIRLALLRKTKITDVIALPKHAFAPYTMQRTAVVIFQKREKELSALDWKHLIKEIGQEKISFFIVDNDGFANSDKRYPTNRTAKNGRWLHNDLADWIANDGATNPSKLFNAAICGIQPPKNEQNEFGEPTGRKHIALSVKKMMNYSSQKPSKSKDDLSLLPDTYIRQIKTSLSFPEFLRKATILLNFLQGKKSFMDNSFEDELKSLLNHPIDFSDKDSFQLTVENIFWLKKGNQGLTEAVIYEQTDPNGLPVYGGGEALPRFKIKKHSKNNKGEPITIHFGPAIIVAMDGSSGAIRVVESGPFCCNHHACVLTPKNKYQYNLFAIAQQLEGGLRSMASNKEGSATLTIPKLEGFSFSIPKNKKMMLNIASRRKVLSKIRDGLFGKR